MPLLKDKFMIFSVVWALSLILLSIILARFFLIPLGLIPLALYELIRTEGLHHTKPLSLATLTVLVIQFLHTSKLFRFPFNLDSFLQFLPFSLPPQTDPVLIVSILLIAFFALLLIRYTWGSVTKFLAILLLAGAALEIYLYWPQLSYLLKSPFVQDLIDSRKQMIQDNLRYRIEQELTP